MIYHRLSGLQISRSLLAALKDFLNNRVVLLSNGSCTYKKALSRGCPQGSVLSPILWNILVNSIFEVPLPEGCSIRAFADDIAVTVEGGSRLDIESKANKVLSCLDTWAQANKLDFSPEKSKCLLMRGSLKRSPIIKLKGKSIQFVKEFKYLGIWLRKNFEFTYHVQTVCATLKSLLPAISTYKKSTGPFCWEKLKLIYKQVILPKLTYGIAFWGTDLKKALCCKAVISLQRSFLIRFTGAYPTSPGVSLDVITLTEPITLQLEKMYALSHPRYTKEDSFFGDVRITPDSITSGKSPLARTLVDQLFSLWDALWTKEPHKWTGLFFPTVKVRRKAEWFYPAQTTVRYLTAHCNCRAYLKRFNLCKNDRCDCGEVQDAFHELRCPGIAHIRPPEYSKVGLESLHTLVDSKIAFERFRAFLTSREKLRLSV